MIRDEYDHRAHDILCIIHYGSPGGIVKDTKAMHRVGDYLRGRPYIPRIEVKRPCTPIVVKLPK